MLGRSLSIDSAKAPATLCVLGVVIDPSDPLVPYSNQRVTLLPPVVIAPLSVVVVAVMDDGLLVETCVATEDVSDPIGANGFGRPGSLSGGSGRLKSCKSVYALLVKIESSSLIDSTDRSSVRKSCPTVAVRSVTGVGKALPDVFAPTPAVVWSAGPAGVFFAKNNRYPTTPSMITTTSIMMLRMIDFI